MPRAGTRIASLAESVPKIDRQCFAFLQDLITASGSEKHTFLAADPNLSL